MTVHKEKYIMLADDDADDRMLFEEALREICKQARFVSSIDGFDLLDRLQETYPPPPDVIFLDINMPRLNGLECLDKIKSNINYKSIPIVIFSTSNSEENINNAYSRGANHYIQKPCNFKDLIKIIEKVYRFIPIPMSEPSRKDFVITL
jgi:CheY-like chemotaxis protein